MKLNYALSLFALSFFAVHSASAQSPTICPINAGPNQSICVPNCANLSGTFVPTYQTTSYAMSSIAYTPDPYNAGTALVGIGDDQWSSVINLPFTFCFFGTPYTQCCIGSNGNITFNTANANAYDQWPISAAEPSASDPVNTIGGPWQDLYPPGGGTIYYATYGSAPCRRFVVSWYNVEMYSCWTTLCTQQITLYETTNIIDNFIQTKGLCTGWNGGAAIQGIQNNAASVAYVQPGRNYPSQWSAVNDAKRWSPNGPVTSTVSWYQGATAIPTTVNNATGVATATVCPLSTTVYTLQETSTNCNGSPVTVSSNMTVTTTSLTLSGAQTNITCPGGCNGSATVTVVSGAGPFTYSWSPSGGNAATASGLCAGSYTCTVTGAASCQGTQTFNITAPPSFTVTPSQVNVSCSGGCNGSATVSVAGGTPAYTYSWSPSGGNAATASGLCVGNYTCTIHDANNCTTTQTFTISAPPALTATQSQVNVNCNGGCNGSATVTASGGTPAYTYSWSPSGGNAATASSLCVGNYTCTITDANGCSIIKIFTITQPTALTATSSSTTATCGSNNGSATVNPAGGSPAYTYSWNPSAQTTATASALAAGTYVCTITDSHGCSITVTVTVTSTNGMTASITASSNVTCNGANNGSATCTPTGGTAPFTYSWNPTGQTTATATNLAPGSYTCTVTDANGCTATASITITQPPALTISGTNTNELCNGGNTASATVTAGGGSPAYTYSWSPSGGNAATASNLTAGNYTCTVTDSHGCTITQTFSITQPTVLSATATTVNVNCNGGNTGSATVTASGGTGAYTYSWNPGAQTTATASNLTAGNYTCTITDANGCTGTVSVTITQPPALTATSSSVQATCGNPNGSATVTPAGGTPNYTYSWNPGAQTTATATGLSANTYTCTITDANGCSITVQVAVTNAGSPSASISASTNVSCFGGNNGSATVTASGGTAPYTYSWSPGGGNAATASNLTFGNYTVTVTDNNGCSTTATVAITQPTQLAASAISTPVLCNGGSTGSATTTVSGGTGAYTYSWNSTPSQSTATASGLPAGSFTCTVTDGNGCQTTTFVTVTQPTALSVTSSQVNELCNGGSNASATVNASGGTGAYTYSWNPGAQTTATATGLTAQSYTCTITDNNGCSITQTFTITEPTALSLTISETDAHCSQPDGSASIVASGGTGAYTYSWSNGVTTANNSNIISGGYTVTVTDANGCSATANTTVNNLNGVNASLGNVSNILCFGQSNGSVTINAAGGTAPYTYNWTPNVSVTNTASGLPAGPIQVTVTDSAGCTSTVTVTLTQPPQLTITASVTPTAVCAGTSVQLSSTPAGGTPGYTVTWTPGGLVGNTQNVIPVASGTDTATVVDANGCTAFATVNIVVNPIPVAAFTSNLTSGCAPVCVDFSDASTVAAPSSITQWMWDFGDGNTSTQQNPSHCYNQPGNYTVILTVTTSGGCTNTITMPAYVHVFAVPVAAFGASPQPTTILDPTVNFTDSSTVASPGVINSWMWSFGDISNPGASSTLQNPSYAYPDPTCYQVVLTVTTSDGCTDTASKEICIQPDVEFFVPNAFTPNGDGNNDVFAPSGIGMDPATFQMWIFDRWGNMIYFTNDMNKGWDGKVQGSSNLSQIDTYVWKIHVTDLNGKSYNLIGHVNMLR